MRATAWRRSAGIRERLAAGKIVLADRYVGSNLAHQGPRVPREKRGEFLQWLKQLEYEIYALPPEDLVIYLRVPGGGAPPGRPKGRRDYTKLRRDLQEADLAHLEDGGRRFTTNWRGSRTG